MKTFVKHSDDCTCQQCMNLMILERIDSLENKIFTKPEKENNQVKEKSAFREWWSKTSCRGDGIGNFPSNEMELGAMAWDAAINCILNHSRQRHIYLNENSVKRIENLREQ